MAPAPRNRIQPPALDTDSCAKVPEPARRVKQIASPRALASAGAGLTAAALVDAPGRQTKV